MPLVAVALVIVAGLLHASWNFVAKKAGGDLRFAAFSSVFMVAVWAPLGVSLAVREVPQWGPGPWLCVLGSSLCHVPYFLLLLRGYRVADLTVVYPVARGSGPLITAAVAITAFGEAATLATGLGVLGVTAGIALVAGQPPSASTEDRARVWRGLRYGLGTGAAIAGYTLVDGYAVKHLLVPPLLVVFMSDTCRTLLLLPLLLRDRAATRALFRQQWRHALAVALLGPAAYILVLTAVQMAPLSHVAPAREISMLFAALLGGRLLGEGHRGARLAGAACMVAGVIALALG